MADHEYTLYQWAGRFAALAFGAFALSGIVTAVLRELGSENETGVALLVWPPLFLLLFSLVLFHQLGQFVDQRIEARLAERSPDERND